jgi:YidC/Oxa1 family membrane protein insertase
MDSLRLFAAIIFLVSVFLLYEAWVKERNPPAAPPETAQKAVTATPSPTLPPGVTAPASPAAPPAKAAAASSTLPVITVHTDVLNAEIDPVGGVLRRLEFTRHKDKVDKNRDFVLFEQSADHTYVAQSGLIGDNLPNHTTSYRSAASNYQLGDGADELTVTLTAPEANRIAVTKRISFQRGSYLINESIQIVNGSSEELKPFAYFQFLRDGKPASGDSKMVPTSTRTRPTFPSTPKMAGSLSCSIISWRRGCRPAKRRASFIRARSATACTLPVSSFRRAASRRTPRVKSTPACTLDRRSRKSSLRLLRACN